MYQGHKITSIINHENKSRYNGFTAFPMMVQMYYSYSSSVRFNAWLSALVLRAENLGLEP